MQNVISVAEAPDQSEKKEKPASTAHLKAVPETWELRRRVRDEAARLGRDLDRSRPLTRSHLQRLGEDLLRRLGLGDPYLGFTMVCISNEFWREQVQAIDFKRRLLCLPHCLKNAESCPADYDKIGLDCSKCSACTLECSIADFKDKAEDMGFKVLVSEGTPIVLQIIVSGQVDAIVGVACLNVLEKAFDKVLLAGVPCLAVPLLSSKCHSTSVDADWVSELIGLRMEPPATKTRTYVPLLRLAHSLCEEPELSRLAPRAHASAPLVVSPLTLPSPPRAEGRVREDKLSVHEGIAYDWLSRGGKHSRPFITLAAYDALQGAPGTRGPDRIELSDSVRRTALAIEVFHKASLVHDDIEDDDNYRYGVETLHHRHGVAVAINVGDYLIGLGYRLISRQHKELGGDCTADILDRLADAHQKLTEGQGAELLWRDQHDKTLTALDALKIYALKTSPAFEAALYAGLRLAGPTDKYDKMVVAFCRDLGIAFQILNDLKDWEGDSDNKLVSGQDIVAGRPTLLLALALEGLQPDLREELLGEIVDRGSSTVDGENSVHGSRFMVPGPRSTIARVRWLFEQAQVFDKAEKLVEKYRARTEAIADEVEPEDLRLLLYYLVDNVLGRHT